MLTNNRREAAEVEMIRCFNWPNWWAHFNGVDRIACNRKIEPGKSLELTYIWHYHWR